MASALLFDLSSSQKRDDDVVFIPHTTVDSLIDLDAQTTELPYNLYILNLPATGSPHAYTYGCSAPSRTRSSLLSLPFFPPPSCPWLHPYSNTSWRCDHHLRCSSSTPFCRLPNISDPSAALLPSASAAHWWKTGICILTRLLQNPRPTPFSSAPSLHLCAIGKGAPPDPSHPLQLRDGGCPGRMWVGSTRYAWVDLSAAPTTHGAVGGGVGSVTPLSLPNATSWARSRDKARRLTAPHSLLLPPFPPAASSSPLPLRHTKAGSGLHCPLQRCRLLLPCLASCFNCWFFQGHLSFLGISAREEGRPYPSAASPCPHVLTLLPHHSEAFRWSWCLWSTRCARRGAVSALSSASCLETRPLPADCVHRPPAPHRPPACRANLLARQVRDPGGCCTHDRHARRAWGPGPSARCRAWRCGEGA